MKAKILLVLGLLACVPGVWGLIHAPAYCDLTLNSSTTDRFEVFAVGNVTERQIQAWNESGAEITGWCNFSFRCFDAVSGGNLLWNETQEINLVVNGTRVLLGNVTPLNFSSLTSFLSNDSAYLGGKSESSLNVNSSSYWTGLSSFLGPYLFNNGSKLDFNQSLLNATIDARNTVADTNCTTDGACEPITYDSETAAWDKDSSNDVTIGSSNLTSVSCSNVSGGSDADYCADSDTLYTNESFVISAIPNDVGFFNSTSNFSFADTNCSADGSCPLNVYGGDVNRTLSTWGNITEKPDKFGNSSDEMRAGVNDSSIAYVFNVSGVVSEHWVDDAEAAAWDKDSTDDVTLGSSNLTFVSYRNITDLPTCSGTDKLAFDGSTLSCEADAAAGGGNSTEEIVKAINETAGLFGINVSCQNISGPVSDLCTLTDTDTNTFNDTDDMRKAVNDTVVYTFTAGDSLKLQGQDSGHYLNMSTPFSYWTNRTLSSYHNISGLPTCSAGDYWTFDGSVLSCGTPTGGSGGNSTDEMREAVNESGIYFNVSVSSADTAVNASYLGGHAYSAQWPKGNSSDEMRAGVNESGIYFNVSVSSADSAVNASYLNGVSMADLNVNSSNYWDGLDTPGDMNVNSSNYWDGLDAPDAQWSRGNTSEEFREGVNITGAVYDVNGTGLTCADCLTGDNIAELSNDDISDTLTASDLVAGSEVVDDSEVVKDLTLETTKDLKVNELLNLTAANGNIQTTGNFTMAVAEGKCFVRFYNVSNSMLTEKFISC